MTKSWLEVWALSELKVEAALQHNFKKKFDLNSSFILLLVVFRLGESDPLVCFWMHSLLMVFKFVYRRAHFHPLFLIWIHSVRPLLHFLLIVPSLTHFDSPQSPQRPIGTTSKQTDRGWIETEVIIWKNSTQKSLVWGWRDESSADDIYIVNDAFKKGTGGQKQKSLCMAEDSEYSRGRLTCEVHSWSVQERKRVRKVAEGERGGDETVISW